MELRRCPYDTTPLEFDHVGADAVLVRCEHCGARWEWHNAHIRRIDEPSVEAVRAKRSRLAETDAEAPRGPDRRVRGHVRR